MKLTAKKISKLLKQPGRYGAGRGLVLQVVSPTNASWLLRYQRDGRERWHGLGPVADFTLVEARERARAARQLLHDGIDPIDHKRAAKAERIAAAAKAVTFGEVAQDYFRAHSPGWKHPKHVSQWRSSILGLTPTGPAKPDYCRSLRALSITQLDTPIILSVLKPIWQDKPETMSRVRARIASVLDYAKAAGYRTGDNPADVTVIGKVLPARGKVNHFAAIDYREIPAFVQQLRAREGTGARCLEFAILCASRSAEAREARWSEIDFDEQLWRIPPERMKSNRAHRVPLAGAALELLHGLYREGDGDDGFVFLGQQPGRPLTDLALMRVMRSLGRNETVHGFRSCFSTWSHETTGYSNVVIEQSLAHAVGSAVERAYRRGDLFEKRRRLMLEWARFCFSPPAVQTAEGKIVPMGRGRA